MEQLIAILFLSRDTAHRGHLTTTSYAEHEALGAFYKDIVELADTLAETYMGRGAPLTDIPLISGEGGDTTAQLQEHLRIVESLRNTDIDPEDTPLQNIADEIAALYLRTLFKLRRLQ